MFRTQTHESETWREIVDHTCVRPGLDAVGAVYIDIRLRKKPCLKCFAIPTKHGTKKVINEHLDLGLRLVRQGTSSTTKLSHIRLCWCCPINDLSIPLTIQHTKVLIK